MKKLREFWITNTGEEFDYAFRNKKDAEAETEFQSIKEIIHVREVVFSEEYLIKQMEESQKIFIKTCKYYEETLDKLRKSIK